MTTMRRGSHAERRGGEELFRVAEREGGSISKVALASPLRPRQISELRFVRVQFVEHLYELKVQHYHALGAELTRSQILPVLITRVRVEEKYPPAGDRHPYHRFSPCASNSLSCSSVRSVRRSARRLLSDAAAFTFFAPSCRFEAAPFPPPFAFGFCQSFFASGLGAPALMLTFLAGLSPSPSPEFRVASTGATRPVPRLPSPVVVAEGS